MLTRRNSTMDLRALRGNAKTHESVASPLRALPSSLRPNLFSGD
jgi:hypothetical protein